MHQEIRPPWLYLMAIFWALAVLASQNDILPNAAAGEFIVHTWTPKGDRPEKGQRLVYHGEIKKGDDLKLLQEIKRLGPTIEAIDISSNGGNVFAAIEMGKIIRTFLLRANAPHYFPGAPFDPDHFCTRSEPGQNSGCVCAGACFFVWAGGISRSGFGLAIHRPYLTDDDLRAANLGEVSDAYREVADLSQSYLKEKGVDEAIIKMMFSVDPPALQYISPIDLAPLTEGYVPAVADWLEARCGTISAADDEEYMKLLTRNARDPNFRPKRLEDLLLPRRIKSQCERGLLDEERSRRLKEY